MGKPRKYCLTIAGFDPSGGAGIVSDCKTFEQLHVHGLSVQTANTIQTEDSFESVIWTPESVILSQLEMLLKRYPVRHFKIGLIENSSVLLAVLQVIHQRVENPFISWDPILKPSFGDSFQRQHFESQITEILEAVNWITPNTMEYESLFGKQNPEQIAQQHAISIYLKGGHAEIIGKDFLYTPEGKTYPFLPKIKADNKGVDWSKHGTGCVLSAAQLAHITLGFPVVKLCLKSKRYLERVLVSNATLLGYHHR